MSQGPPGQGQVRMGCTQRQGALPFTLSPKYSQWHWAVYSKKAVAGGGWGQCGVPAHHLLHTTGVY